MEKITLQADGLGLSIDMETFENVSKLEVLETIKDSVLEWIEEEKEKEEKKKAPIWEELHELKGCYIDADTAIRGRGKWDTTIANQNTFIDEQHAKSALAMAKISQLMPYYGGIVTDEEWNNNTLTKYVIVRVSNSIIRNAVFTNYCFVAFHTIGQREAFMSREGNVQLLRDYYTIN